MENFFNTQAGLVIIAFVAVILLIDAVTFYKLRKLLKKADFETNENARKKHFYIGLKSSIAQMLLLAGLFIWLCCGTLININGYTVAFILLPWVVLFIPDK
ncbi:MAG: hypothetical protein IJ479_08060 [Alphaproteobacteria bacterium]|nr:hypothetical protein [Alphaproteobacteria bacterium]